MENKKQNTFGNRKLIATAFSLCLVMTAGYTMTATALNPVVWGIVSILGLFLTGNLIRKSIGGLRHRDEEDYN